MKPMPIPELTNRNKSNFWKKIDKTPGHGPDGECWGWTAFVTQKGYGQFQLGGKLYRTHRIAYFLENGQPQEGLLILHKCDNPGCCNPEHLFVGTDQDNMADRDRKGRGNQLKGADKWNSKLLEEEVIEIRRRYAAGGFGVSYVLIGDIVNRKKWKHI